MINYYDIMIILSRPALMREIITIIIDFNWYANILNFNTSINWTFRYIELHFIVGSSRRVARATELDIDLGSGRLIWITLSWVPSSHPDRTRGPNQMLSQLPNNWVSGLQTLNANKYVSWFLTWALGQIYSTLQYGYSDYLRDHSVQNKNEEK